MMQFFLIFGFVVWPARRVGTNASNIIICRYLIAVAFLHEISTVGVYLNLKMKQKGLIKVQKQETVA